MGSDTKITAGQAKDIYKGIIGADRIRELHREAARGVAAMKILPRMLHNVLKVAKECGEEVPNFNDFLGLETIENDVDDKVNEIEWWVNSTWDMVQQAEDWLRPPKTKPAKKNARKDGKK